MQEIRTIKPNSEVIDRLFGIESPELRKAFEVRRNSALEKVVEEDTKVEIREVRNIGRNDPCPCGSKIKFKKCCGRNLKSDDKRVGG